MAVHHFGYHQDSVTRIGYRGRWQRIPSETVRIRDQARRDGRSPLLESPGLGYDDWPLRVMTGEIFWRDDRDWAAILSPWTSAVTFTWGPACGKMLRASASYKAFWAPFYRAEIFRAGQVALS